VVGYHVYKRPYVDDFLDFAFAHFNVGCGHLPAVCMPSHWWHG
jgi:hypothetical protein